MKEQYLEFYRRADEILKQPGNPCAFEKIDGVVTCTVSRSGNRGFPHGTLCCDGCEHHDIDKGCTVESLSCKLGWCYINSNHIDGMKQKDHPMFDALAKLKAEVHESSILAWGRASLEQNLKYAERYK